MPDMNSRVSSETIVASCYNLAGLPLRSKPSLSVVIVLVYVAWLTTTPYNRFPLLVDVHFERILVAVLWSVLLIQARVNLSIGKIGLIFLLLLGSMYVSYASSPLTMYSGAVWWFRDYWKVAMLFFAMKFSVKNEIELKWLIAGVTTVFLLYQAYSLLDFFMGGSYVWQQGMRRAVGTWSPLGYGSANAFGFLGVISVAFSLHWSRLTKTRRQRQLVAAMFLISGLAIILSGTRAALVTAIGLIGFNYRSFFFRPAIVGSIIVACIIGFSLLPQDLQDRYLSILPSQSAENGNSVAQKSARSRIEGLKDGIRLFRKRPLLGYGPGTSAYARLEVSRFTNEPLKLHSLYGQLLAELGLVGTLFFVILLMHCYRLARAPNYQNGTESENRMATAHSSLVGNLILAIFAYGAFSHNLYNYMWILAFSLAALVDDLHWQPEYRSRQ